VVIKKQEYARAGVKELWIIDPEPRTIMIHRFASTGIEEIRQVVAGDALSSVLLPGFNLDVVAIFER
jgi:Uma2 family endonuclease